MGYGTDNIGAFQYVPEPGSFVALALGLLGMGGLRLRRK
ncbi:MAG: PEP-CTERM sorting domain-containing protein [Armatimonadota bacterium]